MALPLPLSAFLILTILFIAPKAVECFSSSSSNATRVVDLLMDEDEEFSMDSEANRRILQAGNAKSPNVPRAKLTPPFCDARIYNDCIKGKDGKLYHRPCDYQNLCKKTR